MESNVAKFELLTSSQSEERHKAYRMRSEGEKPAIRLNHDAGSLGIGGQDRAAGPGLMQIKTTSIERASVHWDR